METVPDMDALLDELEEVVVGNKPDHPKASNSCAGQTAVIELPLHLRKLSEKEMIRIDLKPPDPSPSKPEIRSATIGDPVEKEASEINKRDGSNGFSVTQDAVSLDVKNSVLLSEDPHCSGSAELGVEIKENVSDRDTEFEEVLKYLDQFEDKVVASSDSGVTPIPAAPSPVTAIKEKIPGDDPCASCSGDSEEGEHPDTDDILVESTQKDDSHLSPFCQDSQSESQDGSEHESEPQCMTESPGNLDEESLRAAAEAVAQEVLDAIISNIEASSDSSSPKVSSNETIPEVDAANFVEKQPDIGDGSDLCCKHGASRLNSEPSLNPEKNAPLLVENPHASDLETAESTVTVIHKPSSVVDADTSKVVSECTTQESEQETADSTEVSTTNDESHKNSVTKERSPEINTAASRQSNSRDEADHSPVRKSIEHPTAEEHLKEETLSAEKGAPEGTEEALQEDANAVAAEPRVGVVEEPSHTSESVIEEARSETVEEEEMLSPQAEIESDRVDEVGAAGDVNRERGSSEESCHGLETAIECETTDDGRPSPAPPCDRFGAQVIATIHDLSQETDPMRLTESELQLGKSKPYWIPDDDCPMCMLCNARFSLLNRRHHCRACGRVACGSCCKERATLQYMKDEKKQAPARVCTPCASMLARIEDYEKMMREHAEGGASEEVAPSTSSGSRVARGVLKTRGANGEGESESAHPEGQERKRSVVFRDGVKPGASSPSSSADPGLEEKSTTVKPKKKNRKRHAVARRIAELRLEDELGCALPTASRPEILVFSPNGEMEMVDEDWVKSRLKEDLSVTIVLKKNLSCVVKICTVSSMSVFCVHSCGFATIGLDEVLFVWKRDDLEDFTVPLNVLHRIAQIYSTSCEADQAGVRQVCSRLPAIHSVPLALPPLSKHILFFPPTLQDFSSLSVPNSPFLVAWFLCDAELSWAMACPNRLLLRLGLKYSWYPTPVVNMVGREAAYTTETSQTVLKVFTDFRNWSFRMKHLVGCTVTLGNDATTVEIPKSAKQELDEIISWNRSMIAWATDVNLSADSHLVCEENDGLYTTQVLARGASRKATGTSFIIIDGGLKTSGLQISVVEDGVAVRVPSDKLESLLAALNSAEDWTTVGATGSQFTVHWIDTCPQTSSYGPVSPIDGLNLADKYQYGLSLERAISSVLQVPSVPDYGVRLSHVYNLKDGRLTPDDEPKVFSIAEMLARECTGMLEPYLAMLINMNIMSISIRVGVSTDRVEYDVSPWCGMEDEQMKYKQNMDQLIPVLYDILGYLSGGFHIELTLSFVSTKSLPCVI